MLRLVSSAELLLVYFKVYKPLCLLVHAARMNGLGRGGSGLYCWGWPRVFVLLRSCRVSFPTGAGCSYKTSRMPRVWEAEGGNRTMQTCGTRHCTARTAARVGGRASGPLHGHAPAGLYTSTSVSCKGRGQAASKGALARRVMAF